MRRRVVIEARTVVALLACTGLMLACRAEPDEPQRSRAAPGASRGASSTAEPSAPRVQSSSAPSAPVASALIEIRQRAMSLRAPPPSPRHIALGKGFVLHLGRDEAVAFDSTHGTEIARVPIKGPRAALALPAGSVLVAALDGSYRFDPREKTARAATRLSLLPGFILEARRETQEQVWVLQAPLRKLQRYTLTPDAGLGLESERVLPNYDGGAFVTLRDGSLLYTANDGAALVRPRAVGDSPPLPLALGSDRVWRLAAADRVDRAWVATRAGDVLLVEIGARVRVARRIQTGLTPIDFAATTNRFALVSVSERAGEPRQFFVSAYSGEGAQIYSHAVGTADVTAEPNWEAAATAEHELVVGGSPQRLAVGGERSLRVFEFESGRQLFKRPNTTP